LAGGALFAAAPVLCGAHLHQTSDAFRETFEKLAPMLSRELTRATEDAKRRAAEAASDARWAASLRAARDERALRDLATRERAEGRRKGGRGRGLDDARARSRLADVEDRRRALRAERRR
jgi:putative intracellular protease/amidase